MRPHRHLGARLAGFALFCAACYLGAHLYVAADDAQDQRAAFADQVAILEDRTTTQSRRIDELTDLLAAQQDRSECVDVLEGQLEVGELARFEAVIEGSPDSGTFTEDVVARAAERYLMALEGDLCPPDP